MEYTGRRSGVSSIDDASNRTTTIDENSLRSRTDQQQEFHRGLFTGVMLVLGFFVLVKILEAVSFY